MKFFKKPETMNRGLVKRVARFSNSGIPYLYLNKPKCASTTIKRALVVAQHQRDNIPIPPKLNINDLLPKSKLKDLLKIPDETFVFTFVRNPFLRAFSCYRDKCLPLPRQRILAPLKNIGVGTKPVSFGDFLNFVMSQEDSERNAHWRTMVGLNLLDIIKVDFVGSVENLESDMHFVFSKIFPKYRPRTKNNNSRAYKLHISEAFGVDEVEKVLEIYADDFEYFGYSTDPAFMTKGPKRRSYIWGFQSDHDRHLKGSNLVRV